MKIAVFSDSHGSGQKMLDAIEQIQPDMVVHLGDGERDVQLVRERYPSLPLHAVCGNCDYRTEKPESQLFDVNGVKIFITHGHIYGVNPRVPGFLRKPPAEVPPLRCTGTRTSRSSYRRTTSRS